MSSDPPWKDRNAQFTTAHLKPLSDKKCRFYSYLKKLPNRLSSTIGGNREMDQLYTTSQVSNITRKTKFSHIS